MATRTSTWDSAYKLGQQPEDLQNFHRAHAGWFEIHANDDGIAYSLPREHLDLSLGLYRVDPASRQSETALVELCDRDGAIGIAADGFIKYSLLEPQLTWPSNLDLSGFRDLGWDQTDIAAVKSLTDPTEKINHRLRAAAGRLVCTPAFFGQVNDLRLAWRSLPHHQRPALPLARSTQFVTAADLDLQRAPAELAQFFVAFNQFCDEWQLLGMATWQLPDVRGPQWVPGIADDEALRRGELTMTTPWHFLVLAEDGLGRVLEEEHRHQAAERGIEDADSWETYAKLLEVWFWEQVLSERYPPAERIPKFKTAMEAVLGEVLNLSVGRIQRLRTWLHSLQSGSLKSLQGKR